MKIENLVSKFILLTFLAFRGFVYILPIGLALNCGRFLGYLLSFILKREALVSDVQLQFTGLSKNSENSKKIFRKLCSHLGESIVEILLCPKILAGAGHFEEGPAIVSNELHGKSGILLSAHLGNFELQASYLIRNGLCIRPAGRTPNFKWAEDLLRYIRRIGKIDTLWREEAGSSVRMIRMLRTGEIIGALIDQDTSLSSSYVPFFGLPARTATSLIQIGLRYEVPIYSCFIVRTGRLSYKIISELINYDKDDPEAENYIISQYNNRLEEHIRQYPEQWIWWHRRWRRQPENEKGAVHARNSREYIKWLKDLTGEKIANY